MNNKFCGNGAFIATIVGTNLSNICFVGKKLITFIVQFKHFAILRHILKLHYILV